MIFKFFINIVAVFALMTAGLYVLVRLLECKGAFFPGRNMPANPSMMDLPWEDVYFRTQDGVRINAWLIKNARARSTVLFAHGNAGNISNRLFKIRTFFDSGLNVLIFDYRGYGKSEGAPSEGGIYLDALAAYDYLGSRGDVDMSRIILYGESLGGAVAVDLATRRNAALLVVDSSMTSATDMARIYYPFIPSFFLSLKLDSVNKVKDLQTPKLFIHSPEDEIVPYGLGQKLFSAACAPKEFLKISGRHNDGGITADPALGDFRRILKGKGLI